MSARRPLTRGPLPPEIYWRRRFFVVALAGTLVFVIGSALSGGSDGSDDRPVAEQAGVVAPTGTVTVSDKTGGKGTKARRKQAAETGATYGPTAAETVLAEPEGRCAADDVVVTPMVSGAVAGKDVTIGLHLQTTTAEACNWVVNRRTVSVKILDGSTEVWTSRECPVALPKERVVVRHAIATVVEMTWHGRESDRACTVRTDWVLPGDYTIVAAALGGEPADSTFDLATPTASTLTPSPTERATKSTKSTKSKQGARDQATASSTGEPRR